VLLFRAARADSVIDLLAFVRVNSLTFAAAAVFALEDPASSLTDSTRPGRLRLRAAAVAATGLTVVVTWLSIVVVAGAVAETSPQMPIAGLLVELIALIVAGWALAATMGRASGSIDVPARAAGALVIGVALTLSTPRTIRWLWVAPGPQWDRAHARWAVIACLASATFLWASRDPARRAALPRRRTDRPARRDNRLGRRDVVARPEKGVT
jgi:hypothetical protein